MYLFLIPLLLAFISNIASAFTTAYSHYLGQRRGQLVSAILRNVLGMPLLGLAFVLAARWPSPRLLASWWGVDGLAALLLMAGAGLIVWALLALRARAAAPSLTDTLVRQGPYALVRHPLYDGVFCELAGAVLVRPTWPMTLSCLLAAGWLLIQARVEERDLQQRIASYRDYMAHVPRFVPHLRKM
jgi:protein-S-isoprenylcysteine O-methyltransferase Ste14